MLQAIYYKERGKHKETNKETRITQLETKLKEDDSSRNRTETETDQPANELGWRGCSL